MSEIAEIALFTDDVPSVARFYGELKLVFTRNLAGADDVDASCDALRRTGLTFLVEPRDYPWGRSAYLRDPDGRLVELSQS